MFNNKIDVAKGFQTSVNIAYDLNNTGKISGFIPTMSSLDIIEDVLLSTAPNSTERARILIGAYGRGKSHIILVLLSLLYKKDKALFANSLEKMKKSNPKLYDFTNAFESWTKDYPESYNKFLEAINEPIEQFILSLKEYNVEAYEKFIALCSPRNRWC